MKKILVMAVAAMMTVLNVNAQEGYDNTKHEVAVGLGLWSNSEILTFFEKTTDAIFGASVKDERYFGPVSVEYLYRLKKMDWRWCHLYLWSEQGGCISF